MVAALKPLLDRVLSAQARTADELQQSRETLMAQMSQQDADLSRMVEEVTTLWATTDWYHVTGCTPAEVTDR